MLLKNKIRNEVEIPLYDHELKGIEKVADNYAVGFAEWSENYTYHEKFNAWIKNNSLTVEKKTSKELLEIYKKEKKL